MAARAAADRRLRYWSQSNSGIVAARKRAAQNADGDYFIFLDADDELLPGALTAIAVQLHSKPTAMLQFGFKFSPPFPGNATPADFCVYSGVPLSGRAVFRELVMAHRTGHNINQRVVSSALAHRVFAAVDDFYAVNLEDLHLATLFSWLADSFAAFPTACVLHRMDTGVTAAHRLSAVGFSRLVADTVAVFTRLEAALRRLGIGADGMSAVLEMRAMRVRVLFEVAAVRLSPEDFPAGYAALERNLGKRTMALLLPFMYYNIPVSAAAAAIPATPAALRDDGGVLVVAGTPVDVPVKNAVFFDPPRFPGAPEAAARRSLRLFDRLTMLRPRLLVEYEPDPKCLLWDAVTAGLAGVPVAVISASPQRLSPLQRHCGLTAPNLNGLLMSL